MVRAGRTIGAAFAVLVIGALAGCSDMAAPVTGAEVNKRLDHIVGWFDYRRAPRDDAGALAAGTDWSQAQSRTVVLDDDRFEPTYLLLRANTPYRLTFRNAGARAYRFQARRFFKAVAIGPGDDAQAAMRRLTLAPGASATVDVVADRTGTYPLRGTDVDGWYRGLVGAIEVQ